MRIGICILPQLRWTEAEGVWRRAEAYGFDHAWTYDHLSWRTLVDEPWFGTVPTLTAAALVTERIQLGTLVASPNFRHPVPFAKDVMTLDDMSAGRLLLGVGAGGLGFDAGVLGQPELTPRERVARLDEFLELLDRLLTSPVTDHDGAFYRAVGARMLPGPRGARPPLLVAANGPRALDVAVTRGEGWVTTGMEDATSEDDWWRGLGVLSRRLDAALERAGRTAAIIDHELFPRYLSLDAEVFSLESATRFSAMVHRAREAGFTDVIAHWPRRDGIYAGDEAVLDEVAALLPSLRD
ncbi:MAG: LLM class flavin-dependent oxidoreductase [Cellulomonadaceae bacterium]